MMATHTIAIILCLLAIIIAVLTHPFVLRFARKHNIVDNPDARKLQRIPIPAMGGVVAYISIIITLSIAVFIFKLEYPHTLVTAMTIMLAIGIWDDIRDIPASLRFLLEMALVWSVMYVSRMFITDFHGLWNVSGIDLIWAVPISIVAGVGIINAVNLIDGVDGYCSGFGIVASALFAVVFFRSGNELMGITALICAGALVPFFFHNVFGVKSKMFLGDGGSLMIGTSMMYFVFTMLAKDTQCDLLRDKGVCLIALSLAIMSVPVFDTLRVMSARIIRGHSPFSPDKTHLHHLFISAGFSHAGTAVSCILLDLLVVFCWNVAFILGASFGLQLYIVVGASILVTFVFYKYMRHQQARSKDGNPTTAYKIFCKVAAYSHKENQKLWGLISKITDNT